MSLCLACGAANPLDTKFCSQCRTRLLIQDRYRALRIIGQGGFGKTFLAQDEGKPSKPKCVIKQFIYDDPATLREAQRLFEQEAVRLDDLGKHPQIPELLAHCEQEERQYLVQEFIDGENLLQELKRSGRFSEAKIKELLLDLLPVLQFIHAGQVIHRDIKPENVIRRRSDGRLVVVDFGAAKMASQTALQKTGTTIGSAGYAAPEQAFGKALYASDIYSLGVCCLHLLTDINPLTMYDPVEGFVWRDFLPDRQVPNWLDDILEKMTQPNVRQRYQSASEILQILQPSPQMQVSQSRSVSPAVGRSSSLSDSVSLDCGNGVMIELVRVAAGSFQMGRNGFLAVSEKPMHQVSLNDFWIGKYPVTREQYFAVMGNNRSRLKRPQNPVGKVSWHDAMEFCQKLSEKTGHQLRLPTEAEWEYAAKGGNQSKGYQYAGSDNLNEVGWYFRPFSPLGFALLLVSLFSALLCGLDFGLDFGKIYGFSFGLLVGLSVGLLVLRVGFWASWLVCLSVWLVLFDKTHPVGRKKANEIGIYDMTGNVWEWCLDEWHGSYKGKPNQLKNNGNESWDEMNSNTNDNHPLRGGSWATYEKDCRSANRYRRKARVQKKYIGFRLLLDSSL
jgi:formylglycine-generating enzyme required for sulfatase activity